MKAFLLLSLSFLFYSGVCAKEERKSVEPVAFFSQNVPSDLLETWGIKPDRKFTCAIINVGNFTVEQGQANALLYAARVACTRWAFVRKMPDSPLRRFIFDEAEAELITCASVMEKTAAGEQIYDVAGFVRSMSDEETDAAVTQNIRTQ